MRYMICFGLTLLFAMLAVGAARACGGPPVCTVVDPTGTPLNVREGPNGRILSTLNKGAKVEIVAHRDHDGTRWALVGKYAEAWGWVFGAYLDCTGEDGIGLGPVRHVCPIQHRHTLTPVRGRPRRARAEVAV